MSSEIYENEWVDITDPPHVIRYCDKVVMAEEKLRDPKDSIGTQVGDWPALKFRCRRKDLPATAKAEADPEEWVTQDRVPARSGVDMCWWQRYASSPLPGMEEWWTPYDNDDVIDQHLQHGAIGGSGWILNVRCRRKDLPATKAEPASLQNEYVGHVCKLRNGEMTDGPVTWWEDSKEPRNVPWPIEGLVRGERVQWRAKGWVNNDTESPYDLVGICDEQRPDVNWMCAAMSQASLWVCPRDQPDDLLMVTCPVTGQVVELTPEQRAFFTPWLNLDGTFRYVVPLVPKEGYRFLLRDEKPVIKGDMIWSIFDQKWELSRMWKQGQPNQAPPDDVIGPYIRKIEPEPQQCTYQQRLIKLIDARREFAASEDGFVRYWPRDGFGGCLTENDLRIIADELARRNAPLTKDINKYFDQQQQKGSCHGQ
jgi:hypothetical protein